TDLKQFIGIERVLSFEVAEAIGGDSLHPIAIRQHQRHARRIHVAHVLLGEFVEALKDALVLAALPLREGLSDEEAARGGECRRAHSSLQHLPAINWHGRLSSGPAAPRKSPVPHRTSNAASTSIA